MSHSLTIDYEFNSSANTPHVIMCMLESHSPGHAGFMDCFDAPLHVYFGFQAPEKKNNNITSGTGAANYNVIREFGHLRAKVVPKLHA